MVTIATVRLSYSGTNVGTTNWVQLSPVDGVGASISSKQMPVNCTFVEVFDSGGQTMELGIGDGTSGGTKRVHIIPAGGNDGVTPCMISTGALTWIRAISSTASTGELDINFFHGRR